MRQAYIWWTSLCLGLGSTTSLYALDFHVLKTTTKNKDVTQISTESEATSTQTTIRHRLRNHIETLSTELKVDANAAQPDYVKDPFQSVNRKIYNFNDYLDRRVFKPVAIQYKAKVPENVRGSYRSFHNNLGEPWNVTNQIAQLKPMRALKSLGRFTFNSLTTLGLADPASRVGLDYESESLGTTLGYYKVPSGPYLMLPFLGPSTVRDGLGAIVDTQGQLQPYVFENYSGLFWGDVGANAVDLRSSLLDLEGSLQGDRYAAIRDAYLQRKKFVIAEKQGNEDQSISFADDVDQDTAE